MNSIRLVLALSLMSAADAKTFQNKDLVLRDRIDSGNKCSNFCLYELEGDVTEKSYNEGILRFRLDNLETISSICGGRRLGFQGQVLESVNVSFSPVKEKDGYKALRILDHSPETKVYGCFLESNVFSGMAFNTDEEGMILYQTPRIEFR